MRINHRQATLFLLGQDAKFNRQVKNKLRDSGFLLRETILGLSGQVFSSASGYDAVIIASTHQDFPSNISFIEQIRSFDLNIPIFLVVQNGSEKKAVAALRSGATDYYSHPFDQEDLKRSLRHHLQDSTAAFEFPWKEKNANTQCVAPELLGISKEIQGVRKYLLRVAAMDSTVLITGETGTGKELAADFIHWHSRRNKFPFVRINSSAMPEQLVESELFGYNKGAFTGAVSAKPGKFEQADKGTLFLDEIGEMSSTAQSKILRFLESRRVHRLGGQKGVNVDVRIIAATNQELEKKVEEESFRKDLFFRLNVARVHLLPLRKRREDIPVLLHKFVHKLNEVFGLQVSGFSEKCWFCLLKYDWPGNVREVKNVLEATYINSPAATITFRNLPLEYQKKFCDTSFKPKSERDQVLSALFAANWNKSRAAEELNLSRMTLYRKMNKLQIVQKRSFRESHTSGPHH